MTSFKQSKDFTKASNMHMDTAVLVLLILMLLNLEGFITSQVLDRTIVSHLKRSETTLFLGPVSSDLL